MEQVTLRHRAMIMAPAHLQLLVSLNPGLVPLSRASDKALTTAHQLLLLIFGEGLEFSSHPHNCHPITLHSSLFLMRGRNLAGVVDISLMDWELKDSRRRFPPKILEVLQEVGTRSLIPLGNVHWSTDFSLSPLYLVGNFSLSLTRK